MRTSSFRPPLQGHRLNNAQNEDLKNKMTYQQLLNINHDLSKQNVQLKNISNRLGNQLQKLHSQFDIKPREENVELYNAINVHPILNKFQLTLIPLLDTYQLKIQEFEHNYENIHQQFSSLQKKYQEITNQNQRLRTLLTDKIAELIESYKNGTSEKLGTDFTQMIFHQVNEKQKILSEENSRMDRENVKFKAESEKASKELAEWKRKVDEYSVKVKSVEGKNQKLQKQNKLLKEDLFNLQTTKCQLQNQRKKMTCDLQRAQSQIAYLNKHKDALIKNIERLRNSLQQTQNFQTNNVETSLNSKEKSTLQEVGHSNDDHKKLFKLQKQYDALLKQKNKLKDQVEQARLPLEEANERIADYKKRLQNAEEEKNKIEVSDIKSKKMYEKMIQKSKDDAQRLKRQFEKQIESLKSTQSEQRDRKNKRISELQKDLQKVNIEKIYLQNEKSLNAGNEKQDKKSFKGKDNNRQIEKLQDKIALNEQLFKEQIQIIQNDYQYVKRQCQKLRSDNKEKSEELRRTKQELQKTHKELADVFEQKSLIVEQIKRIRTEYEGNLKDKERLFDQKIREIKMFVQQSERRRKADKEKVAEASREFKRVLEEIRSTYEERIRTLQNQQANSKVRKNDY